MAEGDSPTVARRRVRLALREARERAELTQQQVADAMEWSLSKVIRIENGDVNIAPNDLKMLLPYLGMKDRAENAALLADVKIARTRQRKAWYQAPEYREFLTVPLQRLIEYETDARAIRYYQVYFLPGALQTPEYARALTAKYDDEMTAEQMRFRLDARRLRRESLRARLGALDVMLLCDESVFMRAIGGPAIFAEQLRELDELVTAGTVRIRMVPFSVDAPITNNASFDLLTLGADDGAGDVLYREIGYVDELIEDKAVTSRHRRRYDLVWQVARDEVDTQRFIRQRIKDLDEAAATPPSS